MFKALFAKPRYRVNLYSFSEHVFIYFSGYIEKMADDYYAGGPLWLDKANSQKIKLYRDLEHAIKAGNKCITLCSRMLAFSVTDMETDKIVYESKYVQDIRRGNYDVARKRPSEKNCAFRI